MQSLLRDFVGAGTDLGELRKIKAGSGQQWQCEDITIRHVSSGREWKVEVSTPLK
jgi:hypothetical protein